MNFFIAIHPPTATAQERKVKVINGKPIFYDPPAVKSAKELLSAYLAQHRPPQPLTGGLSLRVLWLFPRGAHPHGAWRTTKPDTDNLQKLLKDCMTRLHFWTDDALVAPEIAEKFWTEIPGIFVRIESL